MFWTILILGGLGYLVWKRQAAKNKEEPLHVPNFKKDVVYLVQVNVAKHARTISPFALKLETW